MAKKPRYVSAGKSDKQHVPHAASLKKIATGIRKVARSCELEGTRKLLRMIAKVHDDEADRVRKIKR